jgi:outer membrane protein assembly factor BamB
MAQTTNRQIVLGACLALALGAAASADDWSRFRGPNGSGVAMGGGFPAKLHPRESLVWRTPVRQGKSSPVLTAEHIFLTASEGDKLFVQCFRRDSGALVWERAIERRREAEINRLNEPAAITPVTDGRNVFALFRDFGLVGYNAKGERLWSSPLEPFANIMGHSSSPIFLEGRIVVQADQKLGSYLAGFRPDNGEIAWKSARDEGETWATPVAYRDSVVTIARGWIAAHAASDGRRLWGRESLSPAIVASPVIDGDRAYAFGYGRDSLGHFERSFDERDLDGDGVLTPDEYAGNIFMSGTAKYDGDRDGLLTRQEYLTAAGKVIAPSMLVAFHLDADPSKPPEEMWRLERAFENVIPSLLVYRGVIYLVKSGGIAETLDAVSGESLKRGRLREAIGGYSASPVAADGKVYFASEDGVVSVVRAGAELEVVSVSDLGEGIFATPALSNGRVYVRTDEALYCFRGAE